MGEQHSSMTVAISNLLKESQKEAKSSLIKKDLPSIKEESWRRIAKRIHLPFKNKESLGQYIQERSPSKDGKPSFVEINIEEKYSQEVQIFNLLKASEELKKWDTFFQEYWKKEKEGNYFHWQNLAYANEVLFILIKKDSRIKLPIKYKSHSDCIFKHIIYYIEEGAELDLLEEFQNPKEEKTKDVYWNTSHSLFLEKNAKLSYVVLRDYSEADIHFQRFYIEQKRDAKVLYSLVQKGAFLGKSFVKAKLKEENAEFRGIGIYLGKGKQFHDTEMLVEHASSYTSSSLLYKTVLKDRAYSVFDGQLIIPPKKKKISSYQENHNILLDPSARAETMPRLLIKAEDVSCEHGATVGMLDPEVLFYFKTRGLDDKKARELMIYAFLNELIQEIPFVPEEREKLWEWIGADLITSHLN